MPDIHQEIHRLQQLGEVEALATVVTVKGSTPRAEGAQMLIRQDGSILGSIGGGCIEAAVWQAAKKIIKTRAAQLLDYDLTGREETPEGLICGGTMQVFIEPLLPEDPASVMAELASAKRAGETVALGTTVASAGTAVSLGGKLLVRENGGTTGSLGEKSLDKVVVEAAREAMRERTPRMASHECTRIFVAPVFPEPTVVIFGAGHIGYAVAKIAHIAGFRIVAIDDRPAYANKDRFPDAEECYVEDPADSVAHLNLNGACYAVIACRGHLEDQRVLKEVLQTRAGYIGMIGSRKKTKTVFANLVKEGVAEQSLQRIHSPIGLPIAAETPEDIAISIMAEITDVRRQGKKTSPGESSG
jgi:xanthine dehydrogenase accessory factor